MGRYHPVLEVSIYCIVKLSGQLWRTYNSPARVDDVRNGR